MKYGSVQVITLGCSKNTVDTEHLLALFEGECVIVPEEDMSSPVDCVLINTCGFIGDAQEESVRVICETIARKQDGKVGHIIVFGCLSSRFGKDLPGMLPEVDEWFGCDCPREIAASCGLPDSGGKSGNRYLLSQGRAYAYMKIAEGCNGSCAFCAIPLIRGAYRSETIDNLVSEARELASKGVKELILVAQDTTLYGYGPENRKHRYLSELLRSLSEVEGIEWIRIHYCHPAFVREILDEMSSNPKICKYMDVPLQHISSGVLRKMRRAGSGKAYINLIKEIRSRIPGVVLRTTMMVGHPGEGTREFRQLLDFVREARFERLGAFRYSEEEGTYSAANYEDSVRESTKRRRYDELMDVQRGISFEFNRSRVGKIEKVLADDWVDGCLVCRSQYESPDVDGEIIVKCDDAALVGHFLNVRITDADEYDLTAELI